MLSTKLHIPPACSGLISRARLIEKIDEGAKSKLTLISAPAGFGKTTLLSEWINSFGKPVAWLSLEKDDNDAGRFWAYVLAAFRTVHPGLGKDAIDLQFNSPKPPIDSILTALINEIATLPDPLLFILDDYHVIDSASIQEEMIFLLEHMPDQLHLIIASRSDPAWPLAHWRLRGQLVEIRAADLRFIPQEAAEFLNQTMKLNLSAQNITSLEERTEGWIAGLQMAAISIQGRLKAQGSQGVSSFIETFTGSNRFILDYLMEEVIGQQTEEVRDFLYQTSVLDQFTASLCDALVGRGDSQSVLMQLEQANLFLIPLDDERQWYRYHHLFAELLRKRLVQARPGYIRTLHKNASKWYSEHHQLSEAIRHALEAEDTLLVNELVSQNALAVVDNAELLGVLRHFEAIPPQELSSKPWLGVAYAWILMFAGRLQTATLQMRNIEQTMSGQCHSGGMADRIHGHIKAIRAYIALQEGHIGQADEISRGALELLPKTDLMARGFANRTLGLSLRFSNHFPEAERVLSEAVEIYKSAGSNHQAVIAQCELGTVQFIQGKLRQAHATDLEAVRLADLYGQEKGGQFPANGYAYIHMSNLLYWLNRIEESLDYASKGLEFCRQWGCAEFMVDGYISLVYALSAGGDWDGAMEALKQARHTALNLSEWYYTSWVEPVEVVIKLQKGDLGPAQDWLERWQDLAGKTDLALVPSHSLLIVNCLIAMGRLDQAFEEAQAGYADCVKSNSVTHSIAHLACQAVILHLQHQDEKALDMLDQALHIAEPEGFVRVFIDQGKPFYELLVQASKRGISPEYVEKLLAAFGPEITGSPAVRPGPVKAGETAESLSKRELQVLRLLESKLNTPEIAAQLYISVGTVRTHIKNIYRKLDVNRRIEAVQHARELGLI